jgi:Mg2+ and Co2+ transporter CorA
LEIYWISPGGLTRHVRDELPGLLKRDDGFLWLDVRACDGDVARLLSEQLHFHPLGIRECQARVPIPKIQVYGDHFFLVYYSVEITPAGDLRLTQTSAFINESRYFVTVHGPQRPGETDPADLLERETEQVRDRIEFGRFRPATPAELGHAIVSMVADRMEDCVARVADDVGRLEKSVARARLR